MATSGDGEANVLIANSGRVVAVVIFGFAAVITFLNIAQRLGAPEDHLLGVVCALAAAVLILLSWSAGTKNSAEYYVAGRAISPTVSALGGLAGWFAVPAFTGLGAFFYTLGFDGLAFVAGPVCGLFLSGVLIAPYLAASRASTIPEFLGRRFGTACQVLSAIVVACVSAAIFAGVLSLLAATAAQIFDLPLVVTAVCAAAVVFACVVPGGFNSALWTSAAAALMFVMTLIGVSAGLSLAAFGTPLFPVAAADALQAVSNFEIGMIEKGLADAAMMKPHAKPFLQISSGNFFALIFSLAAATAVLPHVLQRSLAVPAAGAARSATAGGLLLAIVTLLAVSAWAIFAKYQVYGLIDAGTALGAVPDWAFEPSRSGGLVIHGLTVELFDHVIAAVRAGATQSAHVTDALADSGAAVASAWAALKEPVKAALIEAARAAPPSGETSGFAWQALNEKLFQTAAVSAGNKKGVLTLASVHFDLETALVTLPAMFGLSPVVSALAKMSSLVILTGTAGTSLWMAASALSHDIAVTAAASKPSSTQIAHARIAALMLCLTGLAVVLSGGLDWPRAMPIVFAAGGSALFAVVVAGIWWPRANGVGAVLAMLAGLAVSLVYGIGTQFFPAALFDLWPAASDALPATTAKLAAMKSALAAGSGDQAALLAAKIQATAGGTPYVPGVANWWGLGAASAAAIAVPVSAIVIVLVSLLGPRPTPSQQAFMESFQEPDGTNGGSSTVP